LENYLLGLVLKFNIKNRHFQEAIFWKKKTLPRGYYGNPGEGQKNLPYRIKFGIIRLKELL
jgi:hypothetical protein